jgi:hypothetical protein
VKKKIICIFVITLLIVTASPAVGMTNAFPINKSLIEKTGAEDYMMTPWGDNFGFSVSISGDYAIIGASTDNDNGFWSGSAYIFKRDGTNWKRQAKLLASDGKAFDTFGWSVSIDGDYAIIGAYNPLWGSAYVFKREGTSWIQEKKLTPSDGEPGDEFGHSVSISGDYAIIGATDDDEKGEDAGAAYIFKRDGTNWSEQDKLIASDGIVDDWFGWSVSISGDYALIGAWGDDSAYVFKRDGTNWNEQAKLIPCEGWSVSIDGDYAIIGDGAAYVFKRTGTSWALEDKLRCTNCIGFGTSVSISGDYAIIGATYDEEKGYYPPLPGCAYVFKRDDTNWSEQAKLIDPDRDANDGFGHSVSISGDYAIIGAKGNEAAYIFKRDGTNWTQEDKLSDSYGAYSNSLLLRLLERFPLLHRLLCIWRYNLL